MLFKKPESQIHPVIDFPEEYPVFDFTKKEDIRLAEISKFGIGRFLEKRTGMYSFPLFKGNRDIHIGIDFFAPVGTSVYAFMEGQILYFGYLPSRGDYGHTIVTEHMWGGVPLYCLYGHLSAKSIRGKECGQAISRGEILGWVGAESENGGWTPHLHFQVSLEKPSAPDMPGVVSDDDLPWALRRFLDPRIILGPVYL